MENEDEQQEREKTVHNETIKSQSYSLRTLATTTFSASLILPFFQWFMNDMPIDLHLHAVVKIVVYVTVSTLISYWLYRRSMETLKGLK